ncbi:MAG: ATP-dependent DNA ligase [Planctomycetes bacterium]|nr:ATP-dependent DNA ligase [Planctomycetota bacterium]
MSRAVEVAIAGRKLSLTNLDKVLYLDAGFTKAQVIDYYTRIASVMLPHLEDRPITLKRYPNGSGGMFFYEKRCPVYRPDWVQTATIAVKSGSIDFCIVDGVPTLAWLANLACLEIHTYLYRSAHPDVPTSMVFDLDPGAPAALLDACRIGLQLRRLLADHGLACVAKTSGSKGLHVHVPLNPRGRGAPSFEDTKDYAHTVALAMERRFPDQVTSVMAKAERPGKVFIDWSQNDRSKTTCCVYSLRAQPRPTVSAPVTWAEIERAVTRGDAGGLVREADAVLARASQEGDLFADVERLTQPLRRAPSAVSPGRAAAAPSARSGRPSPSKKPLRIPQRR